MKAHKLSVLAAALCSLGALAAPEYVTKEATGEAAIVDNNRDRAFQDATHNALRNAVEQVAGVLVTGDTLTSNSTLVADRVYSHSEGYVKSYDVTEKKEDKGVAVVTVRAKVGTKELDRDLQAVQALIRRFGNRSLVIVINEQTVHTDGSITTSGVVATVLTDGFKQDGWTILDPAFASGQITIGASVGGKGMDEALVKKIGDISKADYFLYGQVAFRHQDPGQMLKGLFPVTGEYQLSVFSTDSGSQLAQLAGKLGLEGKDKPPTISYERTSHDLAIARGADILAQVRKAVIDYLSASEQNGSRLAMTVTGLAEYGAVQNFKKVLGNIMGVRDVRPGKFGGGKAQFDVVFVGTTDDLADKLGSKKFQGKAVNVTGVSGNTIELTLGK